MPLHGGDLLVHIEKQNSLLKQTIQQECLDVTLTAIFATQVSQNHREWLFLCWW